MTARKPATPLPEWVIALVAALEQGKQATTITGRPSPESQFLALVPEHVRQTARRWCA